MSKTGTSAWWADVQYLRDAAERTDEARRRADRADLAARRAGREPRRGGYGDAVALPDRRTVEIRGRTVPASAVPRPLDLDRRRPPRRVTERVGPRPDRLALWALLMGLVLILVAVSTADAATVAAVAGR